LKNTLRKVAVLVRFVGFKWLTVGAVFFIFTTSYAQFYSGSQLTFGKNRVQYIDRFWSYYRFENFDTYFYQQGKPLAIFTAKYFTQNRKALENKLQTQFSEKLQFVIFNKLTDLKQSNVGFISDDYYNIGGNTHIVGSKVFLYFNGDYVDFARQIRAGYAHVLINQSLYGTLMISQIKNSTLLTLPDWYLQGLISYLTEEWSVETDNYVRDGIMSGKFSNFYSLPPVEAAYAGHSFWHFIAQKYGDNVIPNILYMTRISRNVENGFLYVLGISYKSLMKDWLSFYQNVYANEEKNSTLPVENKVDIKFKKNTVYSSVKVSPDGTKIAYSSNKMGRSIVWLYDKQTNKTKKLLRQGQKLDEKVDLSYPLMDWHPSGTILTIIREEKGLTALYFYTPEDKKMEKRYLYHFDKVLSFSYAPSGKIMAVSAVINGKTNIYTYNVSANTFEVITTDSYNDFDPVFINNDKQIIFSSNRISDTLKPEKPDEISIDYAQNRNLYLYDYATKSHVLRPLTDYKISQAMQPQVIDKKRFVFLSDKNGILNRYNAAFDSAVTHIDTTVHYKYFAVINPLTNYKRGIKEQNVNNDKTSITDLIYNQGQYSIFKNDVKSLSIIPNELPKTHFLLNMESDKLKFESEKLKKKLKDTLLNKLNEPAKRKHLVVVTGLDSLSEKKNKVNIDNYVFSNDKQKSKSNVKTYDSLKSKDTSDVNYVGFYLPKQRNYDVEYTIDNLVNQLDFSYLNSNYQTFTGGNNPIYINPGFNALLKLGLTDLLEDNRIVGGVRFSLDFSQSEYLLSYEMLKKRLDKQFIFYRQKIDDNISATSLLRNTSYMGYYILKYPFNNVFCIKGTTMYRYNNGVYLSTDLDNLKKPNVYAHWGGLKGELIFDNTRNQGSNIYFGTRSKIFGEYYQILTQKKSDLFVLGADFRNYKQIYKTFIWANRFAASTSFGHQKLIYYLGGVDTWLFPKFNDSIKVATDQNYAYQTLATNMRGFVQNIRNGNSFALFNTELRFPIVRFFSRKPIKSEFLNSLQIINFLDVGTAWNGLSPYYKDNPFFTQVYQSPYSPIKITVYTQKEPIVEGFGFGLRARMFGYFLRADYAWGVEDGAIRKPVFYLSLSLDF